MTWRTSRTRCASGFRVEPRLSLEMRPAPVGHECGHPRWGKAVAATELRLARGPGLDGFADLDDLALGELGAPMPLAARARLAPVCHGLGPCPLLEVAGAVVVVDAVAMADLQVVRRSSRRTAM